LHALADKYGFFLPRGVTVPALDLDKKWHFEPGVAVGSRVSPGGVVGTVPEGEFKHKIMIPFNEPEPVEITWIRGGSLGLQDVIARYKNSKGTELDLTLSQRWPVRKSMPEALIRRRYAERLSPTEPITTATRVIDTFFPIAQGGTGCIPGPFGAGKTVLQSCIARFSTVDIVIIVACGERAGEVVETITEYPETKDPRTGGTLMDRTIIICNTSSMPVAAREASIYTGITLGEYFGRWAITFCLLPIPLRAGRRLCAKHQAAWKKFPAKKRFPLILILR